jgi:hypothetical protein
VKVGDGFDLRETIKRLEALFAAMAGFANATEG